MPIVPIGIAAPTRRCRRAASGPSPAAPDPRPLRRPIVPRGGREPPGPLAAHGSRRRAAARRGSHSWWDAPTIARSKGETPSLTGPQGPRLDAQLGRLPPHPPKRQRRRGVEDGERSTNEPHGRGEATAVDRRGGDPLPSAVRATTRASLDTVAKAVGVRKQTLLYYFPNKDALLEACLTAAGATVGDAIAEALEGKQTPRKRRRPSSMRCSSWRTSSPSSRCSCERRSRLGPDAFDRFSKVLEPMRERAVAFLEAGMDEGKIRKQDPAMLLFTLYTAVIGYLTEASVLNAVDGSRQEQGLASAAREGGRLVRPRCPGAAGAGGLPSTVAHFQCAVRLSAPPSSRARRSSSLRRRSAPSARRRSATWRRCRGSPRR